MWNDTPISELNLLKLLHLADSALPVGSAAHSFGLETLVENGALNAESLPAFLRDWLFENGALEAVSCMLAQRIAGDFQQGAWQQLNRRLSAMKIARETRRASLALGRRLLLLARDVLDSKCLDLIARNEVHYSTAFGLTAGIIGLNELQAANALLHQSAASLVSVSQRLLPVGQAFATRILWGLKPQIIEIVQRQAHINRLEDVSCFSPLLETAAMRHPYLVTRLFIS